MLHASKSALPRDTIAPQLFTRRRRAFAPPLRQNRPSRRLQVARLHSRYAPHEPPSMRLMQGLGASPTTRLQINCIDLHFQSGGLPLSSVEGWPRRMRRNSLIWRDWSREYICSCLRALGALCSYLSSTTPFLRTQHPVALPARPW